MIEIRFHGMGGQGAVMGALMFAEAAFSEGKFAQKIPVYGGMRRGGDVPSSYASTTNQSDEHQASMNLTH